MNVDTGRFEFPISSSLFDVSEIFASLLLKCELTVIRLLFLDFNETLFRSFFLSHINTMTNYFTSVK